MTGHFAGTTQPICSTLMGLPLESDPVQITATDLRSLEYVQVERECPWWKTFYGNGGPRHVHKPTQFGADGIRNPTRCADAHSMLVHLTFHSNKKGSVWKLDPIKCETEA
jgi:hypothetical protein